MASSSQQDVLVTVGADDLGDRSEAEVAERLRALVRTGVQVDVIDGRVATDLSVYGGGELWSDFQHRWCTTGFSVATAANVTGVATAAHGRQQLPAGSFYDHPGLAGSNTITLQLFHEGSWGDMAYYTTNGTEVDDFFSANGVLRDVTGVKNSFAAGDPVSWYGRTTNQTQNDQIFWLNVSANGASKLVCAIGGTGAGGDSGGPLFSVNTAAGFIKANVVINGDVRVCFSQARYIDEALGTTFIKTS